MRDSFVIAIVFFSIACGFSILINSIFLKFFKNLGMRNVDEDQIRWASQSKPAIGGLSFFIVFLVSISAYSFSGNHVDLLQNRQLLGIIISSTLGFIIGLADDAYNTKPLLKFTGQVLCGYILTATGVSIHLFANAAVNDLFTIAWVVGIMNSINMLDNMDAISTTVSIGIFSMCLLVFYHSKEPDPMYLYILIGIIASLCGFLFFNWNPAKMYMGDTGSQLIGVLLAAFGIICFWNTPFDRFVQYETKQILITLIAFVLPIADTTTVTINRLRAGKSPFVGGKDHTTHHLSYMGFSDRKVAFTFIFISAISYALVYLIMRTINWSIPYIIIFSLYAILVIVLLYRTTLKNKKDK